MDKKEVQQPSDEEHFEDANEKIVNDLIENETGIKISSLKVEDDFHDAEKDHDSSEKDSTEFVDCNTSDFIDEASQKDYDLTLSDEEKLANKEKAIELKKEGNEIFKTGDFEKSAEIYTSALRICPMDCSSERSFLYANRAASKSKLNLKPAAIDDCSKAIELNPNYIRALLRRAHLYEEADKLDESLQDFKKILELDPTVSEAKLAQIRLPPLINERNEKMKTEMLGKLKDLGNMILKPFGLSTNNFQMNQDPNTGSYSVNFQQNGQ